MIPLLRDLAEVFRVCGASSESDGEERFTRVLLQEIRFVTVEYFESFVALWSLGGLYL